MKVLRTLTAISYPFLIFAGLDLVGPRALALVVAVILITGGVFIPMRVSDAHPHRDEHASRDEDDGHDEGESAGADEVEPGKDQERIRNRRECSKHLHRRFEE